MTDHTCSHYTVYVHAFSPLNYTHSICMLYIVSLQHWSQFCMYIVPWALSRGILQHAGPSTIVPVYLEQGYLAGQLQWTGQVIVRVENLDTVIIRKHIKKKMNIFNTFLSWRRISSLLWYSTVLHTEPWRLWSIHWTGAFFSCLVV